MPLVVDRSENKKIHKIIDVEGPGKLYFLSITVDDSSAVLRIRRDDREDVRINLSDLNDWGVDAVIYIAKWDTGNNIYTCVCKFSPPLEWEKEIEVLVESSTAFTVKYIYRTDP